jgi:hypothetical protein
LDSSFATGLEVLLAAALVFDERGDFTVFATDFLVAADVERFLALEDLLPDEAFLAVLVDVEESLAEVLPEVVFLSFFGFVVLDLDGDLDVEIAFFRVDVLPAAVFAIK